MKGAVSMAVRFSPEASSVAGAAVSMVMGCDVSAHISAHGFSPLLGVVSEGLTHRAESGPAY